MHHYIITGTSRGLGMAMAKLLLERGVAVVGIARSENSELLREAEASGGRLMQLAGDLGELSTVSKLLIDALGWLGVESGDSVTLINNAGVLEPIARIEEIDPEDLEHHMRINLMAPTLLVGAFLRETRGEQLKRCIVNITTGAAKKPYAGWSAYCSAKAGVDMLTRVAAKETQGEQVKVIGIAPGVVETEMQRRIRESDESSFPKKGKFLRLRDEGKLADPIEAAARVLQAIEDASLSSGEIVDVRERYPD